MRPVLWPAALLLPIAIVGALSDGADAAPSPCSLSVHLDRGQLLAAVSSSEGAEASATGLVTLDKPAAIRGTVALTATSDTGWPIAVSPQSAILEDDASFQFSVSVSAPAAADAGVAGQLYIEAKATVGGVACRETATATALVGASPYIEVFSGRIPMESLRVNGEIGLVSFAVQVEVRSNAPVTVTFVMNVDPGIAYSTPASLSFNRPGKETEGSEVSVVLRAPGLPPGPHNVSITVVAEVDGLGSKVGHLGFIIFVPRGAASAGPPYLLLAAVGAATSLGAAGIWAYRRKRAAVGQAVPYAPKVPGPKLG